MNVGDVTENVAPAFAAASVVIDVDENDTELVYTPQATDNDALTYTLGGPDADKFVINVDGSVSFVTAPDFEAPGSAAGTNSYSFSVTASDGTLSDVQAVTVNVGDVTENVAPVIPPTPTGGVVLDFEGYASNGDGTHNVPTDAFISYGYNEGTQAGFGYGVETIKEIDGTTDRTMLVVEKAADSWWWGGITPGV